MWTSNPKNFTCKKINAFAKREVKLGLLRCFNSIGINVKNPKNKDRVVYFFAASYCSHTKRSYGTRQSAVLSYFPNLHKELLTGWRDTTTGSLVLFFFFSKHCFV